MHRTRNAAWVQAHRGFESLPLRHNINKINYLAEELAFTRQHSRLNGMRLVATNRDGIRHQNLTTPRRWHILSQPWRRLYRD